MIQIYGLYQTGQQPKTSHNKPKGDQKRAKTTKIKQKRDLKRSQKNQNCTKQSKTNHKQTEHESQRAKIT